MFPVSCGCCFAGLFGGKRCVDRCLVHASDGHNLRGRPVAAHHDDARRVDAEAVGQLGDRTSSVTSGKLCRPDAAGFESPRGLSDSPLSCSQRGFPEKVSSGAFLSATENRKPRGSREREEHQPVRFTTARIRLRATGALGKPATVAGHRRTTSRLFKVMNGLYAEW